MTGEFTKYTVFDESVKRQGAVVFSCVFTKRWIKVQAGTKYEKAVYFIYIISDGLGYQLLPGLSLPTSHPTLPNLCPAPLNLYL